MRKFILLLTCVICFGCGDSPAETSSGGSSVDDVRAPVAGPDAEAEDLSGPAAVPASAADAGVSNVRAVASGDSWTFYVSVDHPDTGWEDYADGWDVVLPDGTVVKPDADSPFTRLLGHPHENERPFTRSQNRIVIPEDVTTVTVRAHDLVDGFGGREVVVNLEADKGEGFTVER